MLNRPPDSRNTFIGDPAQQGSFQANRGTFTNYQMPPNYHQVNTQMYQQAQTHMVRHQGPQGQVPQHYQMNKPGPDNQQPQMINMQQQNQQYQGEEGNYQNQEIQNSQQDPQAEHEQIVMFWQHKFVTIYERFQVIHEKVQWMRTKFYNLNNQLKAVDSQAQWNEAKQHHDDYLEQLQQFSQELAGVCNQNNALYEQKDLDTQQSNIWKQRYYQLFQSYKVLELELNDSKQNPQDGQQGGGQQNMDQLLEDYRQLQQEYTKVISQLTQVKSMQTDMSQVNQYREKLQFALDEADKYKVFVEQLHAQNQELQEQNQQLKQDLEVLNRRVSNLSNKSQPQASQGNNYEMQQQFQRQLQEQLMQQQESLSGQFQEVMRAKQQQFMALNQQLGLQQQRYNKVMQDYGDNQRQSHQEIKRLQREVENKNREIQRYKKNIQDMEKEMHENNELLKQKEALLRSKTNQIRQKINEIRNIKIQLQDKTTQIFDRQNQIQRIKRENVQIQNTIQKQKQYVFSQVSQAPQIQVQSVNVDAFKDKQLALKKQFDHRLNSIQEEYEDKIAHLKKIIKQKEQGNQMNALLEIKLEAIEKKNKNLLYQIQKLNKQLNQKDRQLLESKRFSYDNQKLKQLEYQYNAVIEEKDILHKQLNDKNNSYVVLQTQVRQFETRIRDLGDKSGATNNNTLLIEIEELNSLIQSKENQIKKLRSSMGVKESYLTDMEGEVQRMKSSITNKQKQFEREKGQLFDKIRTTEKKNQEIQKKMKQMEYDYGPYMKKNLQDQIKSLRNQNQGKQQTIMKMQANQLQLQSKISHYQRIRGTINSDMDEMASKIRQNETSRIQMIKKVQNAFKDVKKKDKQIKQLLENEKKLKNTISGYENKLNQTEKLVKEKEKILDGLQSQLLLNNSRLAYVNQQNERLRTKRRDQTDLFAKQSDDLKKKLYDYQFGSCKSGNDTKQQQSELKIQQLSQQKQFLKSQLATALQKLGQLPAFNNRNSSSNKKSKVSKASEGIDYIQKRLFEFNSKLDTMIIQNRELDENRDIQVLSPTFRESNSQTKQIIEKLKSELQQLRKYCAKLEVEAGGQSIRPNPRYSMVFIEQEKAHTDRYNFYKKQNQELEERIEKLIQVNSGLKQRIQSLLRGQTKITSQGFFRQQLKQVEDNSQVLKNKIKKLADENRSLKGNLNQSSTKLCRDYEDKLFESENKIFELERKINSLELQKSKSENERLTLNRNLNINQNEIDTYHKQIARHQKQNSQLGRQVQNLQGEMTQILSKLRVLESQNSRLNQALQSSLSQQHIMLNTPSKSPMRY